MLFFAPVCFIFVLTRTKIIKNLPLNFVIVDENRPQCRYGSTVCKCPISSQTIKCRYKFKSNQKKISPKMLVSTPQGVYQVWRPLADMCKCPISSQTIKYRCKCKSNQKILLTKNACMDHLKVCTKFQVSRTSLSLKKLTKRSRSRSSSRRT